MNHDNVNIFFSSLPFSFLLFSLLFFKSRFCYRFGAGVRQWNRMSAHAGCDVRAAGKPASTVNLPDCLQRKYFLSFSCSPLPLYWFIIPFYLLCSFFCPMIRTHDPIFWHHFSKSKIEETREFLFVKISSALKLN